VNQLTFPSIRSIFEFLTCNYASPVAFYSSENFKSCSFFSNIALDPTDKFLLAGSADGNGYVWDTSWSASAAFKVPIQSQLEVSKVVWKGSTIASISDDLTVSFFKQQMPDCSRSSELVNGARTGCYSVVDSFADIDSSCLLQAVKSNPLAKRQADLSLPVTPIKRSHSSQTPSSSLASPVVNKSILEFFPKSPRPQ
jgi:WD40 repeat protein